MLCSLARALQSEKDKVMRLEENLDQLLLEKNRKILELERKIREVQEAKVPVYVCAVSYDMYVCTV